MEVHGAPMLQNSLCSGWWVMLPTPLQDPYRCLSAILTCMEITLLYPEGKATPGESHWPGRRHLNRTSAGDEAETKRHKNRSHFAYVSFLISFFFFWGGGYQKSDSEPRACLVVALPLSHIPSPSLVYTRQVLCLLNIPPFSR